MTAAKRDTNPKRESILDGAIQAFRDDGYENASMDRIAEIAGASKRTVYNHFESKEALFQAVVERFMQAALALKNIPYDPGRSLEDQLTDFARAKMSFADNPDWLGLLKVTMGVFIREPELAKRTMEKSTCGEDKLALWLGAAHADGKLNCPQPQLAAQVFWAMVGGAFFWPQVFGESIDAKAAALLKDEIIATFLSRYRA